ncbi:MAG: kinase/pyrophosphorylase [Hyphomicrobiales bacterium]|nr:kinase/pyrophosphorylase [Hyphomicrobiales bacterium]
MNQFHLHLVSDSTGETVSSVARSVLSQYDEVEADEHVWSLVRTRGQMEKVLDGIRERPGVVLFTIINEELSRILKNECRKLKIPCVPVLSRVISEISNYIGVEASGHAGRQHVLDEEYFSRVEAINFSLAHDDGQNTHELEEADVVLIGASRTSKTPTCVYLSYRGLRAANIPYVSGCPLPENLFALKQPLIIGLVINPERLQQIRKTRLQQINENRDTSYVDIEAIKQEVVETRKLFSKYRWPVIDVTRKSVEETTATIMQHYAKHREKLEREGLA